MNSAHLRHRIVKLYAHLLRLYPPAFYDAYAQEMVDVFTCQVDAAVRQGKATVLMTCLREFCDLPMNILHQHLRKENRPMHLLRLRGEKRLRRARNFTRAASLVVAFFINWSLLSAWNKPDFVIWSQSIPFVIVLFLANLLLLVAWRWERRGAQLLMIAAIGVGLTSLYSVLVTASILKVTISPFLIVFLGAAWAFPYILFGLLFLNFSRAAPAFA